MYIQWIPLNHLIEYPIYYNNIMKSQTIFYTSVQINIYIYIYSRTWYSRHRHIGATFNMFLHDYPYYNLTVHNGHLWRNCHTFEGVKIYIYAHIPQPIRDRKMKISKNYIFLWEEHDRHHKFQICSLMAELAHHHDGTRLENISKLKISNSFYIPAAQSV